MTNATQADIDTAKAVVDGWRALGPQFQTFGILEGMIANEIEQATRQAEADKAELVEGLKRIAENHGDKSGQSSRSIARALVAKHGGKHDAA